MNSDLLALRIGSQLRTLRKVQTVTLAQLSGRCRVTVSQLSLIENGRVDVRLSTLVRILGALGSDLGAIAVKEPSVIPISTVLEGRERARRRLEEAGIGDSSPELRLDRKDGLGVDTSAERQGLPAT